MRLNVSGSGTIQLDGKKLTSNRKFTVNEGGRNATVKFSYGSTLTLSESGNNQTNVLSGSPGCWVINGVTINSSVIENCTMSGNSKFSVNGVTITTENSQDDTSNGAKEYTLRSYPTELCVTGSAKIIYKKGNVFKMDASGSSKISVEADKFPIDMKLKSSGCSVISIKNKTMTNVAIDAGGSSTIKGFIAKGKITASSGGSSIVRGEKLICEDDTENTTGKNKRKRLETPEDNTLEKSRKKSISTDVTEGESFVK